MLLNTLKKFTKERCDAERPILYIASYWGRRLDDTKKEQIYAEKQYKLMWFAAGRLF